MRQNSSLIINDFSILIIILVTYLIITMDDSQPIITQQGQQDVNRKLQDEQDKKIQNNQKQQYTKDKSKLPVQQITISEQKMPEKKLQFVEQNQQQKQEQQQVMHDIQNEQNQQQECPYRPQLTINDSTQNQLVTVLLEPGRNMWYRGEIVAANRPYSNNDNFNQFIDNLDVDNIMNFFKHRFNFTAKLCNSGPDLAYFCIRRSNGGGKVLYLQKNVYWFDMFAIDFNKLLTINCDPVNYELQSVEHIPYLSKIKFKEQFLRSNDSNDKQIMNNLTICLQSNPGNIIYEKSLGMGEKLYVGQSQILAVSESVLVQKKDNQIVLMGPGMVFLEPPTVTNNSSPKNRNQNAMIMLIITSVLIGFLMQMLIL